MNGSNKPEVIEIIKRMRSLGIDLKLYIDKVIASWPSVPKGFKFTFKQGTSAQFFSALVANMKFAADTDLGHVFQDGYSFREVSSSDSLHAIIIFGLPDQSMKQKVLYCNVHLDTIGVCKSKSKKDGACSYDYEKLPAHVLKDLWKWIK